MQSESIKERQSNTDSPIKDVIAEKKLFSVDPNGRSQNVCIQIGRPYQVDEYESACPLALYGLGGRMPEIRNTDTMGALCLAIQCAKIMIIGHLQSGGKVYWTEERGEELSAEDIFPTQVASPAEGLKP
jgi:hypothetical protein